MSEEKEDKQEIIIVRRYTNDDGGHHGGAWKIAYADFVTAMMAFFLVMWLINSANEATRARVASYFNPIKLTDANPSGKGLKDPTNTKSSSSSDTKSVESKEAAEKAGKTADEKAVAVQTEETAMMANPFEVLDKISIEGSANPSGRTVDATNQTTGDPFDPLAWEALKNGKKDSKVASAIDGQDAAKLPAGATEEGTPGTASAEAKGSASTPNEVQLSEAQQQLVEKTRQEIASALAKFEGQADIKFNVKVTEEGMLIDLSDGTNKSMFGVGSAKPIPALVAVVGAIGHLLENQQGGVVVRGHTDGRRFHNSNYDNWQLSTARAHMASYMLIRGGLKETRISRIEGYGASKLLVPDNPLADENRRVEFLLAIPKG